MTAADVGDRAAFRYLRRVALRHPVRYFATATVWLFLTFVPLVSALLLGDAVDAITTGSARATLGYTAAFVGLETMRILAIYAGVTLDITHRTYVSGEVRLGLLAALVGRPRRHGSRLVPGDVLARARDDAKQLEDTVSDAVDLVAYSVFVLGAVAIFWSISPRIAVAAVVLMILIIVVNAVLGRRLEAVQESVRAVSGRAEGRLVDALTAAETLQHHLAVDSVAARVDAVQRERAQRSVTDRTWASAVAAVSQFSPLLLGGVVLLLAVDDLRTGPGAITLGAVATSLYLATFLSEASLLFAEYLMQLRYMRVSLRRLVEAAGAEAVHALDPGDVSRALHGSAPAVVEVTADTTRRTGPLLVVEDLVVPRDPDDPAAGSRVRAGALTVQDGELVMLTGLSGSGKSTFLRAVLGLQAGTSGRWMWYGREIAAIDDVAAALRSPRVGYLPADPELFNVTVEENITLGRDITRPALDRAVRSAELEEMRDWPEGLRTVVAAQAGRLSGGQRQRVALARVIAPAPQLLVLDGPTSALDATTSERVWQHLRDLIDDPGCGVRGVLVAVERPDSVSVANRRYDVRDGVVSPAAPTTRRR
ncbi:MAG: ATP-binding cassette domain-containing protein [Pseudonocardiaceae bacterium]